MKKKIYLDKNAEKELRKFSENVQIKVEAYLRLLAEEGRLEFPESKKINRNLYELRIKCQGEYRGLYAYVSRSFIIILLFFRKKVQKTPIKYLKTAKRRLKLYE